jgi:hypothetical protein
MRTILLSIFIITLFSGCTKTPLINPSFSKEIEQMLSLKTPVQKCKFPKLPIFKVPKKRKIQKNMSIEDAFKEQNRVNNQLRLICRKYRRVVIETNKRYQ